MNRLTAKLMARLKWHLSRYFIFKYPPHIDIELSSICNLKCSFCPQSETQQDFDRTFINLISFKQIINEIKGKVPSIKLNLRGESTLHPSFIEILQYVKGKFPVIMLNTNGQYDYSLNKTIIECCTDVSFSVDAMDENTYKAVRGGNFLKLITNIEYIFKGNTNLTLSFVINNQNKHQVERFKEFVKKYQSKKVKSFIRYAAERTSTSDIVAGSNNAKGRKNCLMPNRRLVIASNLDVYPCCVQWHKPFIDLGNLKYNNILNIWNGWKIKNLRKDLNDLRFTYSACENCLSRESYKW